MANVVMLCACVALAGALAGCGDAGFSFRTKPGAPVATSVTASVVGANGGAATAKASVPTATASTSAAVVGAAPSASMGTSQATVGTPPAAVATRPPEPTATPATVHIGSASGQPVYLYNSPTIGDRIQAYPEGTPLLVVGGDVEGDGLTWHFVRAPDGTEGYVPVNDTLPADTTAP